jgi:hypothetical protein
MSNIPKLWLAHSLSLIHFLIDKEFNTENYQQLHEEIRPFAHLVEKYKDLILKKIEDYTGIKWARSEIPIYLIPDRNAQSFALPLVIVWRNSPQNRLLVLIHELTHLNLLAENDNLFILNNPLLEGTSNPEANNWLIVKKIINSNEFQADQDIAKEFEAWFTSSPKRATLLEEIDQLEKHWNPTTQPLINYLKKSL